MTEPLKPRIDFDGPLEVDQNPKFRAQQTFDENQAQNFAPATLDEAQEEEGQVEAVMDAALRPKRSLWRKMVMGGLALFGASVVGQGVQWTMNAWQTQDWVALGGCAAGALIIGAGVGSVVTEWRRLYVVEQAQKLAMLSAPLLITGDTGTGKDLFAYACHQASPRAGKPYLALNCASIPEDAVESELFGHAPEGKKGFFEQANGGSVLLDEIGEMSPRMQAKLLRFLNDGTFRRVGEDHEVHVDVRVICATQKNLVELVQKGVFREDLYYRLNVLTLNLPPLRDCPQDIMPLTELFVARFADEQGVPRPKLAADLNTVLTRYAWPGNVRQLKNAIYRALTQLDGYELRPQDILLPDYDAATVAVGEDAMEGSLDEITSRFERSVLTQLYRNYPSTRKLAKRLGVSHTAIANKLREYGLSQKKNEE